MPLPKNPTHPNCQKCKNKIASNMVVLRTDTMVQEQHLHWTHVGCYGFNESLDVKSLRKLKGYDNLKMKARLKKDQEEKALKVKELKENKELEEKKELEEASKEMLLPFYFTEEEDEERLSGGLETSGTHQSENEKNSEGPEACSSHVLCKHHVKKVENV
ncbi:hypothetical protein Tco_0417335 [Tanacetum coccineum]